MIDDDSGTDFLLTKLVAVVIVASLLVMIMLSSLTDLLGAFSTGDAKAEVQRIAEFARLAYATGYADEPADQFITVSIPSSVCLIAFGASLINGTYVRRDHSYFIQYADGRVETFVADVPFASDGLSGPEDTPVLLYPGRYYLKARPVGLNGSIKAGLSVEAA